MGLKEDLHRIEHSYQIQLWQTYKLTEETYLQLKGNLRTPEIEETLDKLNEEERDHIFEELREFRKRFRKKRSITLSPIAEDAFSASMNDSVVRMRSNNLTEMALIYVITLMEAFTKEYLMFLFCKRPELLKSGKSVTYEQVLSFSSLQEIYSALAEEEAKQLSYKSIDQLAEYLDRKFNMDIVNSFGMWNICREASYRRNLIVHNRGIVNAIYASKIENSPEVGVKLDVPINYLQDVTKAIKDYASFVDILLTDKLGIG